MLRLILFRRAATQDCMLRLILFRRAATATNRLCVSDLFQGQRRPIMLTLQVAEMTGAKIDELKALIQEHK